jgi:hypothetical protein
MGEIIQKRRDTTVNWLFFDTVLALGEEGFDVTLKKSKIGDGVTPWSTLPFADDTKADKVQSAVSGSFPALNASGNLVASGVSKSVASDSFSLSGGSANPKTLEIDETISLSSKLNRTAQHIAVTGNSFIIGEVGYLTAAGIVKASASAAISTKGYLVMATASIDAQTTGVFSEIGNVLVVGHGFTVGAPLFLSKTPGAISEDLPVSPAFVRCVAVVKTDDIIFFRPDFMWMEI